MVWYNAGTVRCVGQNADFNYYFFLQDISRSGIVVEEEEDVLGGVIGY